LKVLNSLSRWMGYVSSAIIVVLMLLVTSDVCGRYFFNNPIIGASELARFMMIIIVFPALAWAALAGKHIKVDILVERLPTRVQAIVSSIMLLAALGIYGIITWRSALYSMEVDNITSMLRLPQSIFYWIMTVGFAVFCLSIIALVIKSIAGVVKR
jgi:TRAP-type C4-dicarboxylate transport system permease small subunit